jgi:hypothetical protein
MTYRKGPEVRDTQCLGDVNTTHCTRTLDEQVRILTSLPRGFEQLVQPASELDYQRLVTSGFNILTYL